MKRSKGFNRFNGVKAFLKPTVWKVVLALLFFSFIFYFNTFIYGCTLQLIFLPEHIDTPYKPATTINILTDIPNALQVHQHEAPGCKNVEDSVSPSFRASLNLVRQIDFIFYFWISPIVFSYLISCTVFLMMKSHIGRRVVFVILGVIVLLFIVVSVFLVRESYKYKELVRAMDEKDNKKINSYDTCSHWHHSGVIDKDTELVCTTIDGRVFTQKLERVTILGKIECRLSGCSDRFLKTEEGIYYKLDYLYNINEQMRNAEKISVMGRLEKVVSEKIAGVIIIKSITILEPAPSPTYKQ